MEEFQGEGMQGDASEWIGRRSMQGVADDGSAHFSHRHPDLMPAAGLDEQFHIGHQTVLVEDAVMCDGFTSAAEP